MKPTKPEKLDIVNAVFILLLLCGLCGANYAIDPFNANGRFDLGLEKRSQSYQLNFWNWRLGNYLRDPKPVLLLGDSRMVGMREEWAEKHLGRDVYNFACPGATLIDNVEAFHFARGQCKLEKVYFSVNFIMMNDNFLHRNRMGEGIKLLEEPLRYYSSPVVSQASGQILMKHYFGLFDHEPQSPTFSEEKWQYHLKVTAASFFESFTYPEQLFEKLEELCDLCREEKIELTFVCLPTHVDLQNRVKDFGLEAERDRIKIRLRQMAKLVDFNFPNELTKDKSLFVDPFHVKRETGEKIAAELFGGIKWVADISESTKKN